MAINKQFAGFVRSTAFSLNLSNSGTDMILAIYNWEEELRKKGKNVEEYGFTVYEKVHYLQNRGLIYLPNNLPFGNFCLTKAGTLIAQLLVEAGYHVAKREFAEVSK